MPICGINTSICAKAKEVVIDPKSKLHKLEDVKRRLLDIEDQTIENSRLVRLLEEEIRKTQLKLSVKPNNNAFLLTRARDLSYCVSSNPELYVTLQSRVPTSQTEAPVEDTEQADDTASNWSEVSERYSSRMCIVQPNLLTEEREIPRTIPSDIVQTFLFNKSNGTTNTQPLQSSSNRQRRFVQVTHSRNVSGFLGDYSLYHCTLHTANAHVISNEKRYSDFVALRESLIKSFAFPPSALPQFPHKKVLGKFKEDFIVKRQKGLEDFMESIYLKYSNDINSYIEGWLTAA